MLTNSELKNNILKIIHTSKDPISKNDILKLLNIQDEVIQQEELTTIINTLKEYRIIFVNNNNSLFSKFKNDLIGTIFVNKKGFGFIKISNDEQYYVHNKNINGAFDRDEVLFSIKKFINKKQESYFEGQVIRILKRNTNQIIGTISLDNEGNKAFVTNNLKYSNKSFHILNLNSAIEGDVVIAKIRDNNKIKFQKSIYLFIDKVIGSSNEPGMDILKIVYEFNLKTKFSNASLLEADNIPAVMSNEEINSANKNNRVNLEDVSFITIDGADAKDLDDAIYVKKLSNGSYNLKVAIADVSNYVKPNSPLDIGALERGASAYLVDRVIPMLPTRLSNGICSLNFDEYRNTMVADMIIDSNAKTLSCKIYQGIIKSHQRLTYDEVNNLFNNKENKIKKYIADMLFESKELFHILSKFKSQSGMINLDLKEAKFIMAKDSNAISSIVIRKRDDAEKLIESFMIRANEAVAETIYNKKLPFIYRIHGKPKPEKIQLLWNQLSLFGVDLKNLNSDVSPKNFQKIIQRLEKYDNKQLTMILFLQSMEKAIYSKDNKGHFGLASSYYTHFTSPIRRYPDLLVHRLLKEYIINNNTDAKSLKANTSFIDHAASLSTDNEIKILDCEREVEKMKKAEYMEQFIGNKFDGIISSLAKFGLFIMLDNTIEGLVHISDLDDDQYFYDEKALKLIGKNTNKIFSIGDKVNVELKFASKKERIIDFILSK